MTLTKNKIVDKVETVKVQSHYCIQIRERNQTLEDGHQIFRTAGVYHSAI